MNTKQVNKILKGVKCSRSPFKTYGLMRRINAFGLLVAIDFIVPSFRLITAVAFMFRTKLERVNVFSYTVHNNER
jgi:hypothetical protein